MPSTAFKTVVLGLGGSVGLYYGWVGLQVGQVAREELRLKTAVIEEEKQALKTEQLLLEEEAAMQGLKDALLTRQAELAALDEQLVEARRKLAELEQGRLAVVASVSEAETGIKRKGSMLQHMAAEVRRHREAALEAQQSLGQAHAKVEEAKQLINPFHNPLLRSFASRQ